MIPEETAANILEAAISERRASELLDCLFDGGTATVDEGGSLVLLPGSLIDGLAAMADEDPE